MKSENWKRVKRGQTLILADIYKGVLKVTVIEIDVAVEVEHPTWHKEYPYGLTATTGTVKIRYDTTETEYNLADLIKYTPEVFNKLKTAYDRYASYHTTTTYYQEIFEALATTQKAK